MKIESIIHLQSGDGDSGGISNYISLLVGSKVLNLINQIVLVKNNNILCKSLYRHSEIIEFDNDYKFLNLYKRIKILKILISKYKNSIVHAHALKSGFIAALLKLLFNKKYIYTNHGLRFTQKKYLLKILFFFIEIFVLLLSEKYICIRVTDYNFFRSLVKLDILQKKIKLIRLQIDIKYKKGYKFSKKKFKEPFLILGVGSLIELKRPQEFISWISFLSDNNIPIRAIWLGEGPLKNKMKRITRINKLNIKWLGQVEKNKIYKLMDESTFLIQTSIFEVLPTVVLESFYFGTPIISSYYWGISELISDNKNGLILHGGLRNKENKKKLISIFFDEIGYQKMSLSCKNIFNNSFKGHTETAKSYLDVYQEI